MGCTSQFNMWTSLVAILLSVAFESSIARLPPPININQLDYASGREAVPKMREEDIPLKCGAWKKMDCNDWENNYVMIETPGYPAKYQNKDQCTWTLRIPKEETQIMDSSVGLPAGQETPARLQHTQLLQQ